MKKLNLDDLLNEELNFIKRNYETKSSSHESPRQMKNSIKSNNNNADEEITPSQNFDIVSQLVAGVQTQSIHNHNIAAYNNFNKNSTPNKATIEHGNKKSMETIFNDNIEQFKKRPIDETRSPSTTTDLIDNNQTKRPRISSQTIRKLNQFAFVEKDQDNNCKNNIDENSSNKNIETSIIQSNIVDCEIFDTPADTTNKSEKIMLSTKHVNIQNSQFLSQNSQSISKSQKQKTVHYSQKTLLSINDDDLNFDI